jgi:hypothetical protein
VEAEKDRGRERHRQRRRKAETDEERGENRDFVPLLRVVVDHGELCKVVIYGEK